MQTPVSRSTNAATVPDANLVWMTPWTPENDQNLADALASPEAYAAYIADVMYLGQAMSQLTPEDWSIVSSTTQSIVLTHEDQVGTFTVTGNSSTEPLPEAARLRGLSWAMDDSSNNYSYKVEFVSAQTKTKTSTTLYLTSSVVGVVTAIASLAVKFLPSILSGTTEGVSEAAGTAVADAGEAAAEGAAEGAAEAAGIGLAGGLAAVGGAVAAVIALAAVIVMLETHDFQLRIQVVNQSSKNYLILPNYYIEDGSVSAAAISCAYSSTQVDIPATICKDPTLYPFSAAAQAFNGTDIQATLYTLVYTHSGLSAPGVLVQLVESSYAAPAAGTQYGTLTPSDSDTGWTGLVVNTHYHTDDDPNISLFSAGQDLSQAEKWYNSNSSVTPSSTGSHTAQTTTLTWVLAAGDPTPDPNAGNAQTWHVCITIADA